MEKPLKDHAPNSKDPLFRGFSLIEVLIATGLVGLLGALIMDLMDQQKKMVLDVQKRFDILNLTTDIHGLLAKPLSCLATFEGIDIRKALQDNNQVGLLPFLTELRPQKSPQQTGRKVQKFFTFTEKKRKYSGLKILSYTLSDQDQELGLENSELNGDAHLLIQIDKGKGTLGNSIVTKKIKINFSFDPQEPNKLLGCSTVLSREASIQTPRILDPLVDQSLNGLSGNEACSKRGLQCAYVHSTNYTVLTSGQTGLGHLCASSYNTQLQGVQQGTPQSSFHSCQALLGVHETYQLQVSQANVQCSAIFTAVCH